MAGSMDSSKILFFLFIQKLRSGYLLLDFHFSPSKQAVLVMSEEIIQTTLAN